MSNDNNDRFERIADNILSLKAHYAEHGARLLTLEAIVALLMAEIAVRDPAPSRALGQMVAALGGLAVGLADKARDGHVAHDRILQEVSATVERISMMAEGVMPKPTP